MDGVNTFQQLLAYLVLGGGAGYVAFWLTERLAWPENAEPRRYVSFVVAAAIGLLAWLVEIEFGFVASPEGDWHAWINNGVTVALVVILSAQAIHGRVVLSREE